MIKKVEMETCICDNCGIDIADLEGQYSAFDSEYLENVISDNDWVEHNHSHYCKNCYLYDDNDEIVIATARKNERHIHLL